MKRTKTLSKSPFNEIVNTKEPVKEEKSAPEEIKQIKSNQREFLTFLHQCFLKEHCLQTRRDSSIQMSFMKGSVKQISLLPKSSQNG